jgi:hypothetical protein
MMTMTGKSTGTDWTHIERMDDEKKTNERNRQLVHIGDAVRRPVHQSPQELVHGAHLINLSAKQAAWNESLNRPVPLCRQPPPSQPAFAY